jgi:hypothetical protein
LTEGWLVSSLLRSPPLLFMKATGEGGGDI